MIATQTRRLTVEDYRKLPDDDWRYQLIDGEIIMAPASNFFHQRILMNLVRLLGPVEEEKLGQLLCAPLDLFLDDQNVYQPDILFVSRSRESIIDNDGLHGAPDLIVEILSAHTARYDLNAKRSAYARAGVRELWFVFPEARRVDIYQPAENFESPTASRSLGEIFRSPLFPELEISTDKIFAR